MIFEPMLATIVRDLRFMAGFIRLITLKSQLLQASSWQTSSHKIWVVKIYWVGTKFMADKERQLSADCCGSHWEHGGTFVGMFTEQMLGVSQNTGPT